MFVELMPLLAGRTVLITAANVDDNTVRVNVIPALAKADDNPAPTTPLTYTTLPEELDAQLGKHLVGYVSPPVDAEHFAQLLGTGKSEFEITVG